MSTYTNDPSVAESDEAALFFAAEPNQQFVGAQDEQDWSDVVADLKEFWYKMSTVTKARVIRQVVDSGAFNRRTLAKELGFDKNVTWYLYDIGCLPFQTLESLDAGDITYKQALQMGQAYRRSQKTPKPEMTSTLPPPVSSTNAKYVGRTVSIIGDHPHAGEVGKIVRFEVIKALSHLGQCPVVRTEEGDEYYVTKGEHLSLFPEIREPEDIPGLLDVAEDLDCACEVGLPSPEFPEMPEVPKKRFPMGKAGKGYNESLPAFDDAYEAYRTWLGIAQPPRILTNLSPAQDQRRIVVVNDLHDPFKDEAAFAEMLRREKGKADLCILAGDGADMWSWSRWPKGTYRCSPKDELLAHKKTLNALAETFPEVIILAGNHVDRAVKYLQGKGLPPEMMDYLNYVAPAAISPYAILLEDLPNVTMAPTLTSGDAHYNFLYQVGDLVIGHPEVFSIIPNRAVSTFIHWLQSFALPMGLVDPFKVVGIGHTHQAGKTFCDFGVVGMEMGCMQVLPDYSADPKLRGSKRPPVIGYSVFIQNDGVTDVEESNFIPLRFGRSFIN